jgi:hypothetical protein
LRKRTEELKRIAIKEDRKSVFEASLFFEWTLWESGGSLRENGKLLAELSRFQVWPELTIIPATNMEQIVRGIHRTV